MKIALCIPCHGDPKGKFVQSLIDMVVFTKEAQLRDGNGDPIDVEIETIFISSSDLCQSRHRLVAEAIVCEADFMLCLDADHTFPKDALCRLWTRNLPIVGCNYSRRCIPTAPTAAKIVTDDEDKDDKNLVYTTREKAENDELEEVSHLGLGFCLINMKIFDVMQVKAEKAGERSFLPLFEFRADDEGAPIGEDVLFFRKVRDAGFKVYCDHGLSWEIGHISEHIITNEHAYRQREDWAARQKKASDKLKRRAEEIEADAKQL